MRSFDERALDALVEGLITLFVWRRKLRTAWERLLVVLEADERAKKRGEPTRASGYEPGSAW